LSIIENVPQKFAARATKLDGANAVI